MARQTHSDIKNLAFEKEVLRTSKEWDRSTLYSLGSKAYDIVFSNAALHWIPGKQKAFKNMFESLKVGGKIALHYLDHLPPFELDAYGKMNPENAKAHLPDVYYGSPYWTLLQTFLIMSGMAPHIFQTTENLKSAAERNRVLTVLS